MIRNYAHNKTVKLVLAGLLCASIAQNSCCFFGVFGKIKSIFSEAPKQTTKSSFVKKGFMGITAAVVLLSACYAAYRAYKFFNGNNQGDEQTGGQETGNDNKPDETLVLQNQNPKENPVQQEQDQEADLKKDPVQETNQKEKDTSTDKKNPALDPKSGSSDDDKKNKKAPKQTDPVETIDKTVYYPKDTELGLQDFDCEIRKGIERTVYTSFDFNDQDTISAITNINPTNPTLNFDPYIFETIGYRDRPKVWENAEITLYKDLKTQKFYAKAFPVSHPHVPPHEENAFDGNRWAKEIDPENPQLGKSGTRSSRNGEDRINPAYTPYLKAMIYAINKHEEELKQGSKTFAIKFRKLTSSREKVKEVEQDQEERINFVRENRNREGEQIAKRFKIKMLESEDIVAPKIFFDNL